MYKKNNHITIFEHESLKVGRKYNGIEFSESHRSKLENFYGDKGTPYYNLIHKGILFNEYVGVLHIGNLIIEVLPKAYKYGDKNEWRDILIGMLRSVGAFNVHAPSTSSLKIKTNFILDLYFELFIKEVEYLLNKGLIKKYHKEEGNRLSLKGRMIFSKHIQQNLIHQERFFVKHTSYDKIHILHQVLYKTILLLRQINSKIALNSRIGKLLLDFPEMTDIKITEGLFDRIVLTRKTEEYKNAIEISRLLLLNYHPDLSNGRNNILAIMFDMNLLWERFIYNSLRKHLPSGKTISSQVSKYFWKPQNGNRSSIRPDIVFHDRDNSYVLDTKWKNIGDSNPSPDDLRQLYVYHEYFQASKVALVYPGKERIISGSYYNPEQLTDPDKTCSIIRIPTHTTISKWQNAICEKVFGEWLG